MLIIKYKYERNKKTHIMKLIIWGTNELARTKFKRHVLFQKGYMISVSQFGLN